MCIIIVCTIFPMAVFTDIVNAAICNNTVSALHMSCDARDEKKGVKWEKGGGWEAEEEEEVSLLDV